VRDWLEAFGVFSLAWTVALLLLVPTVAGVVADRQLGTLPWGTLVGAVVGCLVATGAVTRVILRRYERLAPPDPKEEHR
jgi:hypothetical protein